MKILIFGLPGSGKTTLANKLVKLLPNAAHLNADKVREIFNDWDFTAEGRIRQATRMRNVSDILLCQDQIDYVISDFVAPTRELRIIYRGDFVIWMDTIAEGRFEDTNKLWQVPQEIEYDVRITDFNSDIEAERLCNLIHNSIQRNQQE